MTIDTKHPFVAQVDLIYAGLMDAAASAPELGRELGLGGRLFYAGDLEGAGSALVVAANIGGAATLVASSDLASQKQAIREGVIDFLVNSLDEALRILKNEIRKGDTVAVCVSQSPDEVENQMAERGVLPDLLPPGAQDAPRFQTFFDQGARQIEPTQAKEDQAVLSWNVSSAQIHWLPRLDAIATQCIGSSESGDLRRARRWLRLAPRYLGRLAQGVRLLRCDACAAQSFVERVREQVESREIAVAVEIELSSHEDSKVHNFFPPQAHELAQRSKAAGRQQHRSGPTIP